MLLANGKGGVLMEPLLWLAVILLLGALILMLVQRMKRRPNAPGSIEHEQLTNFRQLFERGELSAEEYARLRTLLSSRLQEKLYQEELVEIEEIDESAPPPGDSVGEKGKSEKRG